MKNGSKSPFGLDITHPGIRLMYVLLGATMIWNHFVDDSQTLVGLIGMIVFSTFFLMMAIFSPQMARRVQRQRMENPNPWTATVRHPVRGLLSTLLGVALIPLVVAEELLVSDYMTTGIIVLCGAVSLFLWSFVHAKLNDRCSVIPRTILASPFFIGFVYAVCRLGYLNDQLGNSEATFPWFWFGVGCVASITVPQWFERLQKNYLENSAGVVDTDAPSEIGAGSPSTDAPGNE